LLGHAVFYKATGKSLDTRVCLVWKVRGSRIKAINPVVRYRPGTSPLTLENLSLRDGHGLTPPPLLARPAQVLSRHARGVLRISHRKSQMIARGEMSGVRGPRRPLLSCRATCRDQKDEAREEHTPRIASHLHPSSRMIRKVR